MAEKFEAVAEGRLKRLIIDMPPRHCLALGTPLLTTVGWKTMATVAVGDQVIGLDGKPTAVTGKSPVHRDRRLWRAMTDDGAEVLCDDGHLWAVDLDRQGTQVLPTSELVERQTKPGVKWGLLLPRQQGGKLPRYLRFKPGGSGDVQCIQIDREDGLFLAGHGLIPTHNTKSEFASWLLPSWFLGNFPKKKIIQVSNTESLAAGFGRRVRNLLDVAPDDAMTEESQAYHQIFPDIRLAADSKAAANWHTIKGGEYFAIGVNGKVTGKGADIAIVDDPHSEQEARQAESTPEIFDGVYEWYTSGIRQRLQPGGAIIIVVTRWSKRDLVGQVLRNMENAIKADMPESQYDNWEVLSLPAIVDEGQPTERSMWPGFWPLEELQRTRNALPVAKWQAQYQQNPTSESAAILKRDYWRRWGALANEGRANPDKCPGPNHARAWNDNEPPACKYIIQSWDAAATANDRSHPSAMTLWGVFDAEDPAKGTVVSNLILLSAFKARMEFPELKRKAREFYEEDRPDLLLIENKSAGMQLIQEFRSMGIPAESFTGSSRGGDRRKGGIPNDKVARANLVADIFASRYVWAPERRFAEEVIEQCASFPAGDEDDLVDSTVQALLRFREGGLISTANDREEEDAPRQRRRRYY